MIGIDDVLAQENQETALESLLSRKDGCGPDGLRISEFSDYWKANGKRIVSSLRDGRYSPSIAKVYEISDKHGKRRGIASINVVDRFIERLIQQPLAKSIEPQFLDNSFAYQKGKGALAAAIMARDNIAEGRRWLCEIDIKDYFDSINHECAIDALKSFLEDKSLLELIEVFLARQVEIDGKIFQLKKGLLQGSSLSPIIANMYLHPLDCFLESQDWHWIRFADNIYVYTERREEAEEAFEIIRGRLAVRHKLRINQKKSGVYDAVDRRVLGYDFEVLPDGVEIRKHHYRSLSRYDTWHISIARSEHGSYHIVQDGIINRQDYSLLFENDDTQHHIPVEVTDQINVYGSVTVSPAAIKTLSARNIRISYFDDFGNLMGTYVPHTHGKSANVFLKQCELYADHGARLKLARGFEVASVHNMRANVRYYVKKGFPLQSYVEQLTEYLGQLKDCASVEELMLVEARARKAYYAAFSEIVSEAGFGFEQRTKRPPRDACNALISFGNTVLYSLVLQCIWKTSLDPKIGVVHATNRRDYSLNLDFADLFKPLVVDRTIFTLVNRHEIKVNGHFRETDDGAVLLNAAGKRLFLERLEGKLDIAFKRGGNHTTYRRLIVDEIGAFQRLLVTGEEYAPYKKY